MSDPTPQPAPLLEVRSLAKSFGGFQVVTDVSIAIRPGEVVALIGPNGAGKTTVFNMMSGALRPDSGSIRFQGRDLVGMAPHKVAQLGVGRSYQDIRLFPDLSVADNVAVYARAARRQTLTRTVLLPWTQVLAQSAIRAEVVDALDAFGLGPIAGQPAGEVSYAHQKLVALARLLALSPRILLLDEPASGLDEGEREVIVDAIRNLAATGMTVCIVEHNMDIVRALAARACFLAQGRVIADGPPDELFGASELADIYFGAGGVA